MHVVQCVDFWLDVEAFGCIGVEHFGSWWWWLELALSGFVVVIVMLSFVVHFLVYVVDGVGKRVKVFFFVFFGHVRVIFLFFESHLDRDTTAVEEGLSVEELDC